jgi:membrane protease YdiL (CAAX protease family)
MVVLAGLMVFLVHELVSLPALNRKLRDTPPGGKTPLYLGAAFKLWLVGAGVLGAWLLEGRAFDPLGFVLPDEGWRGASVWIAGGLVAGFFAYQLFALLLSHRARHSYRVQLEKAGEAFRFMPDTAGELRAFSFLGLTAGITEEVIFRGYLIWVLGQLVSLPIAAALALLLFGAFHAYQGIGGFVASIVAGGLMTGLFLLSGSLLPVIVLHALIDVVNGHANFVAKRDLGLGQLGLEQA